MNKIQNIKNKIPALIVLLSFFTLQVVKSQDSNAILQKADSLFELKRYTQSLELYHQLFEEQKAYTPQMLLKMAYVHEALGDISEALYYLNVYYLKTSDKAVLSKMEDLAESYKLSGYQFTDTDLFLAYYYKYLTELTFAALAICLFLLAFLIHQKRKEKKVLFPAAALMLALLLLAYMINADGQNERGIISNNTAYLMEAPSSGSGVVEVVKEGHRVSILGKEDIWVKVMWNGSPAYIRENQLTVLEQ